MQSNAYNGITISVRAVAAPIGEARTALTKISIEGDEAPVCMYSTVEFQTDQGAETHGMQMAEKWIDAHVSRFVTPLR